MKNWRTFLLIIFTILLFYVIKFQLGFPSADIEIIGVILTVASILFGFLAGFFISELWTRYIGIRELQGLRSSETLNMARYAGYFYKNKKFKKEFEDYVEKTAIIDQIIRWDQGHLEFSYFRDIENSFRHIKIKNRKDEVYFNNLLDSYHALVQSIVRLDTLYKERLFSSEWFIVISLSVIIALSVLFLDTSHIFYRIMVVLFPVLIMMAISILYDLDRLVWGRELITVTPSEQTLEAIGRKRFYMKKDINFAGPGITDYRTEDDLTGELRKMYDYAMEAGKKK